MLKTAQERIRNKVVLGLKIYSFFFFPSNTDCEVKILGRIPKPRECRLCSSFEFCLCNSAKYL